MQRRSFSNIERGKKNKLSIFKWNYPLGRHFWDIRIGRGILSFTISAQFQIYQPRGDIIWICSHFSPALTSLVQFRGDFIPSFWILSISNSKNIKFPHTSVIIIKVIRRSLCYLYFIFPFFHLIQLDHREPQFWKMEHKIDSSVTFDNSVNWRFVTLLYDFFYHSAA